MSAATCTKRIGTWGEGYCSRPAVGETGRCKLHGGTINAPAVATWYDLANFYGLTITTVEIQSFTDKTVTIAGRRCNRKGDYHSYFPTREEAMAEAIRLATVRRDSAKASLESTQATLDRLLAEAQS